MHRIDGCANVLLPFPIACYPGPQGRAREKGFLFMRSIFSHLYPDEFAFSSLDYTHRRIDL